MRPLDHLALLLRTGTEQGSRAPVVSRKIDFVLERMRERAKGSYRHTFSEDQQLDAVRRFWDSKEVKSFREAYLLSAGLCLPHKPGGPCLLEDRPRLEAVLNGVDVWSARPGAFRRCYQGLVKCYFTYDVFKDSSPATARSNWKLLRDYLHDRNGNLKDKRTNPDWVVTAVDNQQLFRDDPFTPYVDELLNGDVRAIDRICEAMGIAKASWFLRELVLAQIRGATQLADSQFTALLPRMLELLASNDGLRNRGLILLLNRYAMVQGRHLQQHLRDSSVLWWGNPWLPSNETKWGGVLPEARSMVSEWLKKEFIETFFTKLAEDGLGDRRRMEFWTRYVKAIDHIEFALGSTARNARDRDFVVLREKMDGLTRHLEAPGSNNAFIMWMGDLVAVEFSGMGNALYGYDARTTIPFDITKPLRLPQYEHNSLKQKGHSILWLSHQDGINGWARWEDMFSAKLSQDFGIKPLTGTRSVSAGSRQHSRRPSEAAAPPEVRPIGIGATGELPQHYNRYALNKLAHRLALRIEDKTEMGGNLWVLTDDTDRQVAETLSTWGFQHKAGKGWWK